MLRDRIAAALTEVALAEGVLAKTLGALGGDGPRAEKVAITEDVSNAFARLGRANRVLTELRDLLDRGDEHASGEDAARSLRIEGE